MAEIVHPIDFSPVVSQIDSALQNLKKIEPQIDHPLWMHAQPKIGGHEDVIHFFHRNLHDLREMVSRGAHDKGLINTIQPLYRKIQRDINKLEGNVESKAALDKFDVRNTFESIKSKIEEITKSS